VGGVDEVFGRFEIILFGSIVPAVVWKSRFGSYGEFGGFLTYE
jgi:hypothetical protein